MEADFVEGKNRRRRKRKRKRRTGRGGYKREVEERTLPR